MTLTAQPVSSHDEACDLSRIELCDFENASNAAGDYALENPGVGILINVGTETFPLGEFETAEEFGLTFNQNEPNRNMSPRRWLNPHSLESPHSC